MEKQGESLIRVLTVMSKREAGCNVVGLDLIGKTNGRFWNLLRF